MSFRNDVERTQGLADCFQSGLKALKEVDRNRVQLASIDGSVDVDKALKKAYPNDPRWDYLVGMRKDRDCAIALWIEVHPASRGNAIEEVQSKFDWLMRWKGGKPIDQHESRFYWIASGESCFTNRHPKIRALAMKGIFFCGRRLSLSKDNL